MIQTKRSVGQETKKKNRVIKFSKEPWASPNRATPKTCYPFQKIEAIPGKKTSKHIKKIENIFEKWKKTQKTQKTRKNL